MREPLELVPMTIREARAFVAQHHRTHRKRKIIARFAIGAARGDEVVAAAITGNPKAKALQDGWTAEVVRVCSIDPRPEGQFDGIFVGGSLPWKLATGAQWVTFAHERAMPCHVGRVGTPKHVAWARRIGADSIDSCTPLWAEANLERFVRALEPEPAQAAMPW